MQHSEWIALYKGYVLVHPKTCRISYLSYIQNQNHDIFNQFIILIGPANVGFWTIQVVLLIKIGSTGGELGSMAKPFGVRVVKLLLVSRVRAPFMTAWCKFVVL